MPLDVWVAELTPGKRNDTFPPLASATVAWDPPGGGDRQLLQTDAMGHATVYGDFTKGDGAITIYAADHMAFTSLAMSPTNLAKLPPCPFGKPATDLCFVLNRKLGAAPPVVAHLTGNITNKANAGDYVSLYSPNAGLGTDTPAGNYMITVPTGHPYTVTGWEWTPAATPPARGFDNSAVKWFKLDQPMQTSDAMANIDMNAVTQVTSTKVNITVNIPGGDTGPLGGTSQSVTGLNNLDGNENYAAAPKSTVSADKASFAESVEFVPPPADMRVATRGLLVLKDGSLSEVLTDGVPTNGMVIDGFLTPPPVTITKATNADPIPFDGIPAECNTTLLQVVQNGEVIWNIGNSAKTSPAMLPKLPDDALAALKGAHTARIVCIGGDALPHPKPTDLLVYSKVVVSRTFSFTVQ
jgi:hypothetical protein